MTPEHKEELLARRETLMMQIQQAHFEGRLDDAQALQQSLRQLDAELQGAKKPSGSLSDTLKSVALFALMGSLFFMLLPLSPADED